MNRNAIALLFLVIIIVVGAGYYYYAPDWLRTATNTYYRMGTTWQAAGGVILFGVGLLIVYGIHKMYKKS